MEEKLPTCVRKSVIILAAKYKYKLHNLFFARLVSRMCPISVSLFARNVARFCIYTAIKPNLLRVFEQKSDYCGQICFYWPNLFSLVKSILSKIWCTSQSHQNWLFFWKIHRSKRALFVNVGRVLTYCGSAYYFFIITYQRVPSHLIESAPVPHWQTKPFLSEGFFRKKSVLVALGRTSYFWQNRFDKWK